MKGLTQDLRYAFRMLARSPVFTFVAVGTLVLGIGANTAIFSIVNAVLLEPLPYDDPERLVRILAVTPRTDSGNINPLDALDLRENNQAFEHVAVLHNSESTVSGLGDPVRVGTTRVTHDFFEMLGVTPQLGSEFNLEHETVGNHQVAVITHNFWLSYFGGAPDLPGRTLRVNDQPYEILGVLPPGFQSPVRGHHGESAIFRPMAIDRENEGRGGHYMQIVAKLKPGVSPAQAALELERFSEELAARFPGEKTGRSMRAEPLANTIFGDYRRTLIVLMAAVGLVLLIACTNVASLFLARAAVRRREISIRTALGAGRRRIIRQLLTESLAVAILGGTIAVAAGAWLAALLRKMATDIVPRVETASVDLRVLAFTFAAAAASALLFGVLPALFASRAEPSRALHEGGRSHSGGRDIKRSLRWMVVVEVALSIVLMSAAGLLLKSLWKVSNVKPGFDVEQIVFVPLSLPSARYPEDPDRIAFVDELVRRLESHPQVAAAATTSILPFSGGFSCDGYEIKGQPTLEGAMQPCAEVRVVSDHYFEAMGIPILRGSNFDPAGQSALVSRSMAPKLGHPNPIGVEIRTGWLEMGKYLRTVGVSEDVRHFGLNEEPRPEIYLSLRDLPLSWMTVVVRSHSRAEEIMPIVKKVMHELDPALPVNRMAPMSELIGRSLNENRLRAVLLGLFAAMAMLLAAAGIYGVLTHSVANRTQELGVRMALGADRKLLLRNVLQDSLTMFVPGVLIGIAGSLYATRLVESLLYETSPVDLVTLISVVLALGAVVLMASFGPARRATRVDPISALRAE